MKFYKVIVCALVALVSANSKASGWTAADAKVIEIYPSPGDNLVNIKLSSMTNPDACKSPSYIVLQKSNPMFTELYTLIVSAQARQSNIRFQLVDCNASGFPIVNQLIAL